MDGPKRRAIKANGTKQGPNETHVSIPTCADYPPESSN